MPSRPSSSRADAISTLMNMSQSLTRVGYVPAELQNTLNKGLQRPVYTSPPRFFTQRNLRLNQQAQNSPKHSIYHRPKRFISGDPQPSVYVRNLGNEIRTVSSPESYRRYPKQSFHTIQSASITYKIALSNHQTKLMHIPSDIRDLKEADNHSVGGFRPIHQAAAGALVNTKAPSPGPRKDEQHQERMQDTFLTEPPIDYPHLNEALDSPSPSPLAQQVLDDDALIEGVRYLYPKVLTPDRRRLDRYTQASNGYVGKEFVESTEKYSVGQRRLIAERYNDEYINQLPSSQYKIEKSNISKCDNNRSSSLPPDPAPSKQRSRSEYSQTSIIAAQRQQDNKVKVQVELNKLAWEDAFIKKIDIISAAQLGDPTPSTKPREKPPRSVQRSRKRFAPLPQLENMYATATEKKQRPHTARSSLTEVRELVVTSIAGQRGAAKRPVSATTSQSSALPSTSLYNNLSSDGIKEVILTTKLMTNVVPSKAETRTMCEFHRRAAQDEKMERTAALFNPNILDLFTRLGEQHASTLCEHYNKNRSVARRLVLTQILHLCRQHMCMQYFGCISIVHNPFQPTQLFSEWRNHCIVIRACLQALYRLRFFHIITDQLLYYLPESFFNGIVKVPLNQLGFSPDVLRSYFVLKPSYNEQDNNNISSKLMTSLSPKQDDPQTFRDPKLSAEPEISISVGLFPDHKQVIDLSAVELSTAISEGAQQGEPTIATSYPLDVNMNTFEMHPSSALSTHTLPRNILVEQQYLAPPSLEVAVAIASALAERLNIFTRQVQRKLAIDGAFLCEVIAFVGACNYDCYYEAISPIPLEERPSTSSNLSIPRVRARSYNNHGEAPVTRILDYLCVEILNILVNSYNDSPADSLTYITRSSTIPSTASQLGIIPPFNRVRPTDIASVDWSSLSLYDSFINTISYFLISCNKDRFAAEHSFLLAFNPQLSYRMFEAVAIVLKNMPVHVAAQYFDRVCLVAFCTITYIKGAIVSASTRKVITTIFQGVILPEPYTIANGYYLLSTCITILLDMRIVCKESQGNNENVKYLSYLLSELCLLSGIIVETHCLSLASGIALGNLHMMFSNYPSDISGTLPPFIFFFTGAEDASHTDISIDNEKTGIYLKYYVASFIMRLGISYIRCANRLNLPVSEIISDSKVFRHLYQEYSAYREKYVLVDEFCKVVFENNRNLASTG